MIIYKITNLKNGKIYIGQTIKSLKERWRLHKFCSMHPEKYADTRLSRAIRKHGLENFTIEEIEKCENLDLLNEREVYWITFYNTIKTGYNVLHGGKNSKHSEESKQKISKANFGRKFTEEWKINISNSKKGQVSRRGFKMPDHVKTALLKANKNKVLSEEHKNKISVALSKKRNGENNPFFNKTHSDETKLKMSEKRAGRKPNQKIKECEYQKISEYLNQGKTMNEISKIYNVSQATISNIKKNLVQAGWIKLIES